MTVRSEAQRAAEARYEAKRPDIRMQVRMSAWQSEWLDARRRPDESRPAALRRLARMPDMPPNNNYPDRARSNDVPPNA